MKRSSLQWKLTLWFSAALVLMAVLTFIVVFFVSHSVLQKQLRTELIHTVEDNVDEVEFTEARAVNQDGGTDHYIRYGVGYLEIDDDFSRSGERHGPPRSITKTALCSTAKTPSPRRHAGL